MSGRLGAAVRDFDSAGPFAFLASHQPPPPPQWGHSSSPLPLQVGHSMNFIFFSSLIVSAPGLGVARINDVKSSIVLGLVALGEIGKGFADDAREFVDLGLIRVVPGGRCEAQKREPDAAHFLA